MRRRNFARSDSQRFCNLYAISSDVSTSVSSLDLVRLNMSNSRHHRQNRSLSTVALIVLVHLPYSNCSCPRSLINRDLHRACSDTSSHLTLFGMSSSILITWKRRPIAIPAFMRTDRRSASVGMLRQHRSIALDLIT